MILMSPFTQSEVGLFGSINKFVNGPLWRLLLKEKQIGYEQAVSKSSKSVLNCQKIPPNSFWEKNVG